MAQQQYTSADTSLNQVPALHRWYRERHATSERDYRPEAVVDLGAGKYDAAGETVQALGVEYFPFDPYNRTDAENATAMAALSLRDCDVLCANVLNVIKEAEHREGVIRTASRCSRTAYFTVYEGDGTGVGKRTTKGWQNNRKVKDYICELDKYFDNIVRHGNVLRCWN